jgi:hypothetical protein
MKLINGSDAMSKTNINMAEVNEIPFDSLR